MTSNIWVNFAQKGFLSLILLHLQALHLVKVYLLPLLEIEMHAIFGGNITQYRETLGDQFCMKSVVWIKLVHMMNVIVGDVTSLDACCK